MCVGVCVLCVCVCRVLWGGGCVWWGVCVCGECWGCVKWGGCVCVCGVWVSGVCVELVVCVLCVVGVWVSGCGCS